MGPRARVGSAKAPSGRRPRKRYAKPSVTVDIVIFTVVDGDLKILLIERSAPPFEGHWALPGGFVEVRDAPGDQGEDLETAAHRELCEETGLPEGKLSLEQLHTFGRAGRDPRTRVITVAYVALCRPDLVGLVRGGSDAAQARWVSWAADVPSLRLAFDHRDILAQAVRTIRARIDCSSLGRELLPRAFTAAALRAMVAAVKGPGHDSADFRRCFARMLSDRIIVAGRDSRRPGAKRAPTYRFVG